MGVYWCTVHRARTVEALVVVAVGRPRGRAPCGGGIADERYMYGPGHTGINVPMLLCGPGARRARMPRISTLAAALKPETY